MQSDVYSVRVFVYLFMILCAFVKTYAAHLLTCELCTRVAPGHTVCVADRYMFRECYRSVWVSSFQENRSNVPLSRMEKELAPCLLLFKQVKTGGPGRQSVLRHWQLVTRA